MCVPGILSAVFGPFATVWPAKLLTDLARYLIAAGGLWALIWGYRAALIWPRKIQTRSAGPADMARALRYSAITVRIFSLSGFVVHLGAGTEILQVYTNPVAYGWAYLVASFAVMVVAHDSYFYWLHRAMHCRRLFRLFHRTHHKSRTPTPWAACAFDPAEAVVQAVFLPLYLALAPTHVAVIFAFVIFRVVGNVVGHAGFELHPKGWVRHPVLGWLTTTTHHDLHHAALRCNYGLYFTWWDRLMGTEHPHYRQRFDAVVGDTVRVDVLRAERDCLRRSEILRGGPF